jgi:hypothetical protein
MSSRRPHCEQKWVGIETWHHFVCLYIDLLPKEYFFKQILARLNLFLKARSLVPKGSQVYYKLAGPNVARVLHRGYMRIPPI